MGGLNPSVPGPVVLIGGEEFEDAFEEVHRSLLRDVGQRHPKVVFFPTAAAADGPGVAAEWGQLCQNCLGLLGAEVSVAPAEDRAGAESPATVALVREADVIYLGGGKPGYLLDVLSGSSTWHAIKEAHRAGKMLIGASAGAMVLGEYVLYIRSDGDYPPRRWVKSLDLLHGGAVAPHLNRFTGQRLADLKAMLDHKITLIGIDEFTALVIGPSEAEVRGSGRVCLQGPGGERWYSAGRRPLDLTLPFTLAPDS